MSTLIDRTGQVFGRLTVVERAPNDGRGRAHWVCRCECGQVLVAAATNLHGGRTTRCATPCVLAAGRTPWPRDPRYFVGRDGSIVSPAGVLLKAWPNDAGYPVIGIYPHGKCWPIGVHIIVCETFHGPKPDGMEVAHEDGDRGNPHADNLRWSTHVDNIADKIRHGTSQCGERSGVAKLTESDVRAIRADAAAGKALRSIAAAYRVTPQNVRYIVQRKTWRHVA